MKEFVIWHKIRLEVGIHIRLWLHVLQHIPNICTGFIVHGNTLDAMSECLQYKDRVFPIFRRAIDVNITHGSCHTQHELPVTFMVIVKFPFIAVQLVEAIN